MGGHREEALRTEVARMLEYARGCVADGERSSRTLAGESDAEA